MGRCTISGNSQKELIASSQSIKARVRVRRPRCTLRPDDNGCVGGFGSWPSNQAGETTAAKAGCRQTLHLLTRQHCLA